MDVHIDRGDHRCRPDPYTGCRGRGRRCIAGRGRGHHRRGVKLNTDAMLFAVRRNAASAARAASVFRIRF